MNHRIMLDWVKVNLGNLWAEVSEYNGQKPFEIYQDFDPENGDLLVKVRDNKVQGVPYLEMKVGDIVHNLRVSLDYIAFAIAFKHNRSYAETSKTLQFPVCEYEKDWGSHVGKMKDWCPAEAIALLKEMQPFRHEMLNYHYPLAIANLDNPHKHKSILAAAPDCLEIDWEETNMAGRYEVVESGYQGEFVDGIIIQHIRCLKAEPTTERVGITMKVGFDISFGRDTQVPMMRVGPYLIDCVGYFESEVFPNLERFT